MKEERLQDRGVIQNNPNYRKRVYRVQDGDDVFIKVHIVDKNFKPIYEKNVKGLNIAKEKNINVPKIISTDDDNLIFCMEDVGENLLTLRGSEDFFYYLRKGILQLYKLNKSDCSTEVYQHNFYISKFISEKNQLTGIEEVDSFFDKIIDSLDHVKSNISKEEYGLGVTDSTFSNMCIKDGIVYLIDFDNFSSHTSFCELLGFIVGDIFFRLGKSNLTFADVEGLLKKINISKEIFDLSNKNEKLLFLTGFFSLHLILIGDIYRDLNNTEERLIKFFPNIKMACEEIVKI